MNLNPFALPKKQVEKTTRLLAKQYKTFSLLYREPLDHQQDIFKAIIQYRYQNNPEKARPLLSQAPSLLDLKELVIEILDLEQDFNRLPLDRQVDLERVIEDVLEEAGVLEGVFV